MRRIIPLIDIIHPLIENRIKEFALWITASVIMGVACEIMLTDKIKLPLATFLHFLICFAVVVTTAFLCGYIESAVIVLKWIVPMFVAIYFFVFAVIFISIKANEKNVNKALNSK